jgi:predicted Zn-dependent peptidase
MFIAKKNIPMKKISLYILFVFFTFSTVFAQVDRTTYPAPGPAPSINIGDAESFTLPNGLKVFVVENHKLPRVTFSLILDRDPILEGDKAGLTSMVGELMRSGTKNRTKDQLDEAIDQIGGSITVSSTSVRASSLTKHKETLLDLFSDILFNPSFPSTELDKIKKQYISSLAAEKDNPNSISTTVTNAVLYGKDHPYGEKETEKTIGNVEVADIQNYYTTYFKPNIAYLAIVGDITKSEAEKLVNAHFSNWKQGVVPSHVWPAVKEPSANKVILVDRPSSVQSVINVAYPVDLQYNSPDRIPVTLLSYILGGGASSRLFLNLRESKGFTYGAYASINPGKLVGEFSANASVRTEITDSAAYEIYHEMNRLDDKTISEEELTEAKAYLTGSFGRSLEDPATIASFALNAEIQKLPKDYYKNYLKNLDAVSVAELDKLAPKYIKPKHSYLVIVGNAAEFKDKVAQFGEVINYTAEGDLEEKKEADASVTAESVIDKYINALGGKAKIATINTLKQKASGEVQDMLISQIIQVDKGQGKALQLTLMGPQEVARMTITREKVTASSMGQEQELPGAMAEAMKSVLDIVPEVNFANNGTKITLDGISKVNGEDAYKVVIEQGEVKSTDYFSVASGLKLKSESPLSGEISYSDYKDYDGVRFPSVISVNSPQMPVTLKMTMEENVINPTFTEEDWK